MPCQPSGRLPGGGFLRIPRNVIRYRSKKTCHSSLTHLFSLGPMSLHTRLPQCLPNPSHRTLLRDRKSRPRPLGRHLRQSRRLISRPDHRMNLPPVQPHLSFRPIGRLQPSPLIESRLLRFGRKDQYLRCLRQGLQHLHKNGKNFHNTRKYDNLLLHFSFFH